MAGQEDPAAIPRWRVVLFACWPACQRFLPNAARAWVAPSDAANIRQSITRLHQSHDPPFDLPWANGRATVDLQYA
jgi:hypothetical protein